MKTSVLLPRYRDGIVAALTLSIVSIVNFSSPEDDEENLDTADAAKSQKSPVSHRRLKEDSGDAGHPLRVASAEPAETIRLSDLEQSDRQIRSSQIADMVRKWAKASPQECLDWALQLKDYHDRSAALVTVVSVLLAGSEREKDMAEDFLVSLGPGELKDDIVAVNFPLLLERDVVRALDFAQTVSGKGALRAVAQSLAGFEFSNEVSNEFMRMLDPGFLRNNYALEYVKRLADEDPGKAMAWVGSNDDFEGAEAAFINIAAGFGANDPLRGIEASEQLQDSSLKKKFTREVGLHWAMREPVAAGDWVLTKALESDDEVSGGLTEVILSSWIQWDHDAAFEKLEKFPASDKRRALKLGGIEYLSLFDADKAADRLLSDPEISASERVSAMGTVTRNWMTRNSIQASQWVLDLETGSERDVAIGVVVDNVLSTNGNVEVARSWAGEISDAKERNKLLERVRQFDASEQ